MYFQNVIHVQKYANLITLHVYMVTIYQWQRCLLPDTCELPLFSSFTNFAFLLSREIILLSKQHFISERDKEKETKLSDRVLHGVQANCSKVLGVCQAKKILFFQIADLWPYFKWTVKRNLVSVGLCTFLGQEVINFFLTREWFTH